MYAAYILLVYQPPSISAFHDFAASIHSPMAYLIFVYNLVYICTTQSLHLHHLVAGFCFHLFSCHCSGVPVLGMHFDNLKLEGAWGREHTASPTRGTTITPLSFSSCGSAS